MTTLNRDAAAALREVESLAKASSPIHAVTDVTGFSFLGHAREMALGSAEALASGATQNDMAPRKAGFLRNQTTPRSPIYRARHKLPAMGTSLPDSKITAHSLAIVQSLREPCRPNIVIYFSIRKPPEVC